MRKRIVGGLIAMALISIASATGGAAAEGDGGAGGVLAVDPALALEGDVLDETLGGQEALAILEAGGHVEEVADVTGETPESPEASAALAAEAAAYSDAETFTLHSLPSSTRTIYLDFDGASRPRRDGSIETMLPFDLGLDGTVDGFSSDELAAIREVWVRVAEYYAAFDVDVTTEDPGVDALRADYCRNAAGGYLFACPRGMTPDGEYPSSACTQDLSLDPRTGEPYDYDWYQCPTSGWNVVPGDQEYGTRVVFTSGAVDGAILCSSSASVGCSNLGTFRDNEWHWATPEPPLDPKALVMAGPNVLPAPGLLTAGRLADVAAHEIGHVVGLWHEPYETGSYSCQPTVAGAIYSALMHPCSPSLGTDPRLHFTPQICTNLEEKNPDSECNANFTYEGLGYRDSYGWMALNGLFARADEASPVVASGSSFTGSGVISPPLITQSPFYAPFPALSERELHYFVGEGLEYGGGLNLNRFDATSRDVGSIIDTLDDAAPQRGYVTVMSLNRAEYEVWVVSSVAVSADGVRHVTAVRKSYNASRLASNGFPVGEEVIVRVIGVGASGPMDTDAYDFTVTPGAGPTDIRVTPAPTSNLDVKATLYRILADDSLEEIEVSDPPAVRVDADTVGGLDASISATLAGGDYRLIVEGTGLPGVYTNYGSIGTYTISIDTEQPTPCGVGTWSATGTEPCTPAAPGSFVATEGAIAAVLCAVGSFQPQTGQSSCIPAPIGYYVGTVGAVAATACPAGTTTLQEGATSLGSCVSVIAYRFTGFSSPINGGGVLNQAKAGQTVPLKWRLTTADGLPVTDLDSAVVRVTVTGLSCSVGSTVDAVEEYSTGSSGLQNLGDGYYQWNWKTAKSYAGSCKTMTLSLGESNGATHIALFKFIA
ncbi:MAG: PxKF domain-containing protein [Acidimicrobiales bacterium]